MKFKVALVAIVVVGAIAACFLIPSPNENSVESLRDVVAYVDPEVYYNSDMVQRLQSSEAGQGMAILPKQAELDLRSQSPSREPNFIFQAGFVGPETCKECHADYYDGFVQTAHYKTSALADGSSIRGSFADNENVLNTKRNGFRYQLTNEEGQHFQKLLIDKNGSTYEHSCRFDIVTGSGNVGQTYLYWQENSLYQLPISWLSKGGWVNSPNYPDGLANFARPIQDGCMSCHATMVEFDSESVNVANPKNMILGVTCERCHGPAESHVKFHRANPEAAESKFIVHPNDLPRERLNDICAQCHSGESKTLNSTFNFRPGDSIHDYKKFKLNPGVVGSVHTANQYPRMTKSTCYTESDTMSCATCHNPHQDEHGRLELFSSRCMKCHESSDCGKFPEHGARIESNCIDCHMPKKDDTNLKFETTSASIFPEIRDHFIRIDADATNKVLEAWAAEGAEARK
ncbi:multiheme c-type cytochrome [Mariniblastus fucicola]|uniref:Doubled CXXCH motif (Paired_CXXCH_1) n=1 Tax=Mariniblastus fucicola TaxID=980251 RepID=A0A5B9PAH6_9BACT|nr:multiheme c-type cytochrome [Mariniblastus fucicola]QEG23777.1 Doubled CXXCH motif (Paired_CXXCH_1) [Mariniblastus fucicola]